MLGRAKVRRTIVATKSWVASAPFCQEAQRAKKVVPAGAVLRAEAPRSRVENGEFGILKAQAGVSLPARTMRG